MKRAHAAFALVAPALLLAGCDQTNAPSEKVEEAAATIVSGVATETPAAEVAGQGTGPFSPQDECADLEGAPAFIAGLRSAAKLRDPDLFTALAAEDVKLDFGGGAGHEELRRRLSNRDDALWRELDELLALGCAANGQAGITLPWYFAQNYEDPGQELLVMGEEVFVHQSADPASPRIASVTWDMVEYVPTTEQNEGFIKVRVRPKPGEEKVVGYMRADKLRSVLDYRLIASSRNGRWRITSFIAGD